MIGKTDKLYRAIAVCFQIMTPVLFETIDPKVTDEPIFMKDVCISESL
jgi:hypothetical protein